MEAEESTASAPISRKDPDYRLAQAYVCFLCYLFWITDKSIFCEVQFRTLYIDDINKVGVPAFLLYY